MMPVVRLNDATFSSLKSISTWLGTKTPSETIDRVVRDIMDQLGLEQDELPDEATANPALATHFNVAPGLSFTKPLKAAVNGKNIQSPRWASILLSMIAQVRVKSGLTPEQLVNELGVPAKVGRFEEEGFKYHPNLKISVQGQSASEAWKEVDRLAQKWRIPVSVEFWWRQNPKAQYPGKTGSLRSGS